MDPVWAISKIMFLMIFCNVTWPLPRPIARNHAPKFNHRLAPSTESSWPPKTCCPWTVGVKLVSCLLGWHVYHLSVKNPSSLIAWRQGLLLNKRTTFFVNWLDRSWGEMVNKFGLVIPTNGLGKGQVTLQKIHANMILLVVQTGWWYHQHYSD